MATLTWRGRTLECGDGTVLDALARDGIHVPSSCRVGACQSCLVRAVSGALPREAQKGLGAALASQGYFLACQARLTGDLVAAPADDLPRVPVRVTVIERLTSDIARIHLVADEPFVWRAGQFVHLERADGLTRPYSVASATGDGSIELHVKRLAEGAMSRYLFDDIVVGTQLQVRGPSGECVYQPSSRNAPLVLAGTGTGLAPLLGVLRDALAAGHSGPIEIHHGALVESGLYADSLLAELADQYTGLMYFPCILQGDPGDVRVASLRERVAAALRGKADAQVFLCGPPETMRPIQRDAFLAGMPLAALHSDLFVTAHASP